MTKYIVYYRLDQYPPKEETVILTVTWPELGLNALDITGKVAMTRLEFSIFNQMLDDDQVEYSGKYMRFEIQESETENGKS
ncbi:MAG: hypothetical protein JEZ11_03805 [Desulfobacterales bacterium]|nr:hypothetical protein [Desulfobacterales bacterium]